MSFRIINQKGIGLVETVLALGVSVVIVTSLVSLTVYTVRSSLQSKLMMQGTKSANEQLERLRALRDQSSWSTDLIGFRAIVSACTQDNPCLINENLVITQADATDPLYFYATSISGGAVGSTDSAIRFNVVATWTVGDDTRHTYTYTDLTNWRGN